MSFAALKKNRGSIADLAQKVQEAEKGAHKKDERLWELSTNESGVGEAIIRFLPESEGNDVPFVTLYQHGFKDPATGKWFIENCPTTIGGECPVCEKNSERWNSGMESDKNIARPRSRKKSYYANIYVVNDPAHPENNGKVFIYRFGVTIMRQIMNKIKPEFATDTPVNVFDLWEGANFKLRASLNQKRERTYENSQWEAPSQLKPTDEELEAIWKQQHNLKELVSVDKFLPAAELLAKFNAVTKEGNTSAPVATETNHVPSVNETAAPSAPAQENAESNQDEIERYRALLGV